MRLVITTHSGKQDTVEVEEYDAAESVKSINDCTNEHVIAFGDNIYSKIDIKSVKPFVEDEEIDELAEGED